MTKTRTVLALAAFALFVGSAIYGVLAAIAPPPAPAGIEPGPPLSPRLADRLLLVVVDGLRYDIATNPAIMPNFAASMKRHSSGEIWAGRVSMTTSAVLGLGTGQRGRLEQIIRNIGAKPPPYNSWLENAHAQGLRLAAVGDPVWPELYSAALWKYRRDPEGVAIHVDFNPKTFADARELLRLRPDFLVVHFVTPDHQGHAHGIQSERYRAHMRQFDQDLQVLLKELDPSFSVIVTSDHGAADSGTHGTDVPIQRRCPIYAYGPGIIDGVHSTKPLDQLDLAVTLAVLLGVPPAAHGTGHLLVDWLDVSDSMRKEIVCENARRVLRYTQSLGIPMSDAELARASCEGLATSAGALEAAERKVRSADAAVSRATGLTSNTSLGSLVLIASLAVVALAALVPRLGVLPVLSGIALVSLSVWLVLAVERLPGVLPNGIRASLFVACNAALLWLIARPKRVAAWLEQALPYSLVAAPGALVVSYPANARPQSFVVVALLALLCVRLSRSRSPWLPEDTPAGELGKTLSMPWTHGLLLVISVLSLLPVALRENAIYSGLLSNTLLRAVLISGFVAGVAAAFGRELLLKNASLLLLIALGLLPTLLRPSLGPWVGKALWLVFVGGFLLNFWRHQRAKALIFGAVSVLWVSRDFEAIPLLATLMAAWIVGPRLFGDLANGSAKARIVAALCGFSALFCLRMGLQDGLEFAGMDWGAGGFNDANVSPIFVAGALIYKYAASAMLVGIALGAGTSRASQAVLFHDLSLCWIVRIVSLTGMFFIAGGSYWTALRVIGDLPTALAMGLGCMLGFSGRMWAGTAKFQLREGATCV